MRKKKGKIVLIFVLILLIALVLSSLFYIFKNTSACGDGKKQEVLVIEEGESFDQVLQNLEELNLIHSKEFASLYVKFKSNIQYYAGNYTLNDGMKLNEILNFLNDSSNATKESVTITIPEGKWAKEIAEILSQQLDYSKEEIIAYWNDETNLKEWCNTYEFLNFDDINQSVYKIKLEGYLFPETYSIEKDATLDAITRTLLNQFDVMYQEYKDDFKNSDYSILIDSE